MYSHQTAFLFYNSTTVWVNIQNTQTQTHSKTHNMLKHLNVNRFMFQVLLKMDLWKMEQWGELNETFNSRKCPRARCWLPLTLQLTLTFDLHENAKIRFSKTDYCLYLWMDDSFHTTIPRIHGQNHFPGLIIDCL